MKKSLFAYCTLLALTLTGCSSYTPYIELSDEELQADLEKIYSKEDLSPFKGFYLDEYKVLNQDKCTIALPRFYIGVDYNEGVYWDGICKDNKAVGLGQVYIRQKPNKLDYLVEAGDSPKIYFMANNLNKENSIFYMDVDYLFINKLGRINNNIGYYKFFTSNGSNENYIYGGDLLSETTLNMKHLKKENIAFVKLYNTNKYNEKSYFKIMKDTNVFWGMSNNMKNVILDISYFNMNGEPSTTPKYLDLDGKYLNIVLFKGNFVNQTEKELDSIPSTIFSSNLVKYLEDESLKNIDKYIKTKCNTKRSVPNDVIDRGQVNICNYHQYSKKLAKFIEQEIPKQLALKYQQQEIEYQKQLAASERNRVIAAQEMMARAAQQRVINEQRLQQEMVQAEQDKADALKSLSRSIDLNTIMPKTHNIFIY